ncbi:Mur ligase domain-containing protein [Methylobacterium oryzae CBMB20]
MTALWTREELESATGGRLTGFERPISGASIDTRTLQPGDLFFAIRGDARDGHDFVPDALARGPAPPW